ncbi:MAG: 30S ribosomal protein S7 [Candidatus Aminicenantes bacterium]|jgi:small subunit ribosomal protein S7|nr:30S ribosomal protein S7 [Candidatus Aminicenantes bacterium]
MPRKKINKRKQVFYDPVYNSSIIAKLINNVMFSGKKALAQKIVYGAMDVAKEKLKEDPLKVVLKAIENVRPHVETRSRRVGGATYQVPMDVRKERSYSLGLRWLVLNARGRGGKSFREKLVGEIIDAYNKKGGAIKKKETVHKMAESNRAFAHYRW